MVIIRIFSWEMYKYLDIKKLLFKGIFKRKSSNQI